MNFSHPVYIASCVFTREEPALSVKIQNYLRERFNMLVMRCCVRGYKEKEYTDAIPDDYRDGWKSLPQYLPLTSETTLVSVCHNCSAVIEESKPEVPRISLWEWILSDAEFRYPDYGGEKIALQDCWRSYDNRAEQDAVRELLRRMNVEVVELEENREKTQFCGISTLQPQPRRNPVMAPRRFAEGAKGKFEPHTPEEQKALMEEHCSKIPTDKVVAYCHYCVKGLKLGGKNAMHLGNLLFL